MKKLGVLILGLLVSSLLLTSFACAQASPVEDLKSFVSGASDFLTNLFETLLGPGPTGNMSGTDVSYLFARVLFLLIVFVVVWAVLSKIPIFSSSTWMVTILSVAVALLSTRFLLSASWVETILLPYSVLGIAITAVLPLIIYFFFVTSFSSKFLRKVMWVFAAVVFVGLWISRYNEIKGNAEYIYPVTALLCLILFAADGSIQKAFAKEKAENALSTTHLVQAAKLRERREEIVKVMYTFPVGSPEHKKMLDEVEELKKQEAGHLAASKGAGKKRR